MEAVFQIIIIAIAGCGAGIVTGLASASAANVVTPMLVAFSICDPFTAITISLMTDTVASAFTAITFAKNGNIKIKEGLLLSLVAVPTSVIATKLSKDVNSDTLMYISMFAIGSITYSFYKKSIKLEKIDKGELQEEAPKPKFANHKVMAVIIFGIIIGFICGFVGAGGGLMILMILTTVMSMDTKSAIGTSVLIMMFIAFVSGVSHIALIDDTSELLPTITGIGGYTKLAIIIAISSVCSILGAVGAANFANKAKEYKLLRMVSIVFGSLVVIMIISKFV